MSTRQLTDGAHSFGVTVIEPPRSSVLVLFGVGRGGDPGRHLPLMESLASRGCTVVAPHFERLTSPIPTEADLRLRARRLRLALEQNAAESLPVVGVGHSLGATMLLALAGAELWTADRQRVVAPGIERLQRLALMAPPTDFFRAPGALDGVRTPILAWSGTADTIVTTEQVQLLHQALAPRVPVEIRMVAGAGHFSFMNLPPPQASETLSNREAFLADLAEQIGCFVMA